MWSMTVNSAEKQGTKAQGKLESKQQNQLGDNPKDLKQQKANIVDPYISDNQQSSGKHGLNRSQWIGDL